ncbi:MAG: hypothetical protein CM1200mP9_05480 [Gammaproteobacteria bacterium]|nr:MAG: hypothetical protein CM1200mP9_05480 [Gammaproteobacteria bacterium]
MRARNVGKDITAGFRALVGGEIAEYVKLMAEAREQSVDRMIDAAEELGANAIVGTRFTTSMVMSGAAEISHDRHRRHRRRRVSIFPSEAMALRAPQACTSRVGGHAC